MFEKNMKIIKDKDPVLYSKLIGVKASNRYRIVESKNGLSNIEIESNRYLHSKYDPKNEAKKWVDGIDITDNDSLIVVGLGLGYYLDELIRRFPKHNIIVIEPDIDIFYNLISIKDVKFYYDNPKVTLLIDLEKDIVSTIINEHFYFDSIRNPFIIEIPAYKNLYSEEIINLYENIHRNIVELRGDLATRLFFANFWIDNTIRNLKYITKSYSAKIFYSEFCDIPTIIVSAGPSLDKNVKILKELYDKALIIAVGSAVNILEKNNIKAHMVMGIDGSEAESKIFNSLISNDAVLLYAPTVHYKTPELYKGNKVWFGLDVQDYINNFLKQYYNNYPIIASGPSVANIALDFAIKIFKSKKIFFIGQDLEYTNEKIYADGHVNKDINSEERDYNNKDYVLTKDIYGDDIYTKKTFLNMQKWFEDYIRINEVSERVINCTQGGIGIPGIRNLDLKEAISIYCNKTYNIDYVIEQCISKDVKIDIEKYSEELTKFRDSINNCNELSVKRVELLQDLFNDVSKKKNGDKFSKKFEKILKVGKKLEKEIGYKIFIYPLLKTYIDITTFNTNRMVKELSDVNEARYNSLKILFNQYFVIDNSIKVASKAFEINETI